MCTSTDDCFCHEQVTQKRSPNCSYPQTSRSSALIVSGGSWSAGGATPLRLLFWERGADRGGGPGGNQGFPRDEHLLERVAPETQPQRLERDHLVGRDVAQIDIGAEVLHEPRLGRLRRRLPDD